MKRILWFRRDLRTEDNPLLSLDGEMLPVFIFDTNILEHLEKDDRRVSFIFQAVLKLKEALRQKDLDLKVFFGDPIEIFAYLETLGFDEVAASGDYDAYARQRDIRVSHILHFHYLHDTYIFVAKRDTQRGWNALSGLYTVLQQSKSTLFKTASKRVCGCQRPATFWCFL